MRRVWRVSEVLLLPTIGLGVALALAPNRAAVEIHVWLIVALSLGLLAALTLVRTAFPSSDSPFIASLRAEPVEAARPQALVRLEREVSMAGSTAFDVQYRLRPALIELAAGLVFSRRGIDFEREPDRAHAALGDDVWEIVRPDRPESTTRLGEGITAVELERVVNALEAV